MALYDGFISYSHAKDKPIAAALQSAIQKLGKPWYRRRALRLFRDDTSLSATPHLWPTIEQALGESRFFLLLASPEAAASKWVNKEVAYWLEHNSIETLLIGLTDGELLWDDSGGDFVAREKLPLPPALAKRFVSEPKWVDLRSYREGAEGTANKRDAKFTELSADFAAAIRGMPKEDLLSQEVRQQRRALRLAIGAAAALLVLALAATTAGILAYRAQQETIAQRNRTEDTLAAGIETANGPVSLNNLAWLYVTQGRYAEAEALYKRSLAIDEKALGPNHPDVATDLNNLAGLFRNQGRYAEAEPLYKRALAIYEKALGPDHPDVAQSLNNLAALYREQGRYAEAEPLIKRALAIREKVLGPDHPNVATALDNLALLYQYQGRPKI